MLQITSILLAGFILRIFAINWDQGFHFHPDERMLILVAEKINFFKDLNPDFFNYGSLPIYLLKGVAQFLSIFFGTSIATYDGMLYVGRFLSTLADVGTIFIIYKIARLLFKNEKVALFSSLFYAVAFFPIQNSHFFIVDTFLTFFISSSIYFLLLYFKKSGAKEILFASLFLAAAVTSKFTAVLFLPLFLLALLIRKDFLISAIFALFFIISSFIFMPFAFVDYQKFLTDITLQLKLNSDPYIFPYTLQYVGSIPYLYYLKNIFWFGAGPFISAFTATGLFYFIKDLWQSKHRDRIIWLSFFIVYFLVIGKSASKFMRYMLPIYPFLMIFAGYGLFELRKNFKKAGKIVSIFLIGLSLAWTLAFLNIYTKGDTRVASSKWIHENIPTGKTLAVEHWDDRLPVLYTGDYNFEELTLYDQPDNEAKWTILNEKLDRSDYVIIASNRLYVPIQRLNDCQKYLHCFPLSSVYYQKLFNSELPFKKVAEFSSYPNVFGLELSDDWADESFTVYDHPKIMIFKKSE